MRGKRAYAGRRPEGIVAALSRYFHRLLRLFADDHAVRPHADGDKRLSRGGCSDGPAEPGTRWPAGDLSARPVSRLAWFGRVIRPLRSQANPHGLIRRRGCRLRPDFAWH